MLPTAAAGWTIRVSVCPGGRGAAGPPPAAAAGALGGPGDARRHLLRIVAEEGGAGDAVAGGAQGEAVLSLLTMIRGDATRLASIDLAALLSILRELGAGDIARDLAFEIAIAEE